MFMPSQTDQETKARLVAAASALFGDRGFHGTKVRDIAARGGVNLASGHYHYGSKKALYLEVLREQFAEIGRVLQRLGARPTEPMLRGMKPDAVAAMLHTRIQGMLDHLLGPPPSLHGQLMMRELMDPSEALPIIVAEFIRPMQAETEQIIARLIPELDPDAVQRCAFSIVGQVLFYRFAMPAMLHMMECDAYPPAFTRTLADHILTFSLGGMERVAAARPRRKRRVGKRQR
jgi:AcrR family transcriptional regulator